MRKFFVFDVESVGLHGEGFAVGGGLYLENGSGQWEFRYACHPCNAGGGTDEDLAWVRENVPDLGQTFFSPRILRASFWDMWLIARDSGAEMAFECGWPVEARFLIQCIDDDRSRKHKAPYPIIEISSVMMAAGMDPMATYDRLPSELPKHDPLADARQSARLLCEALSVINRRNKAS